MTDHEKLIEVYEKYKHLDRLFSDPEWIDDADHMQRALLDCWTAITETIREEYIDVEEFPYVRVVRVLEGKYREWADAMDLDENDMVIVREDGLEKIVGSAVEYLQKNLK